MQLECQLLDALNCAPGAANKVWGCSACPAGFGASSVGPPYFCDVACPSSCANCDNIAWPLTSSDDGLCNACAAVRHAMSCLWHAMNRWLAVLQLSLPASSNLLHHASFPALTALQRLLPAAGLAACPAAQPAGLWNLLHYATFPGGATFPESPSPAACCRAIT